MGFATFKTWELLVCKKKKAVRTHSTVHHFWPSPSSMLLGNIQELHSLSPKSHETAGEEGGAAAGPVCQSLSLLSMNSWFKLCSPPSEDLSFFFFHQAWTGNTLNPCPHDRGWSPAAPPHDTTAGSLCSAGRNPSRPPRTSPSPWRGTRPRQTSPHTEGASWCGLSSSVPSRPQIQRPGSSVCRGGWSPQWQTSAPPPAQPS